MAKALVTQERVFEVAQALTDKGIDPTIVTVQEGIGGGSYSTVKRYLDMWKESLPQQRRAQIELPEAAVNRLMALGRDFWAMLDEQASQQVENLRAATQTEIHAIQNQLDQAEQAISKLEAEKEQLEQSTLESKAAIETLQNENQGQRERATIAETRAVQLDNHINDLKAEIDRSHKELQRERQAVETARTELKTSEVENGKLQGEAQALRSQVQQMQTTIAALSSGKTHNG